MNEKIERQHSRRPFITAHSGCMNTRQNSIDSITEGIRFGADIIEVDVNATSDGVPVLFHDHEICFGNRAFPIEDIRYKELKDYNDGLVRLDEAFKIRNATEKLFNLDIKNHRAFRTIVDTIVEYDMTEKVFITGCDATTAYKIKTYSPEIQVLLNVEMAIKNIKSVKNKCNSLIPDICNKAVSNYCCGINVDYQYCKHELITFARRRGLLVFVWTIDDTETMRKFLDLGVDSITTNEVELLRDLLT